MQIEHHERQGTLSEQQKEKMKSEMVTQIAEMKERISGKEQQISVMEQELSSIKDAVQGMVGDFNKSRFFLSVAQNM